MKFDQPFLVDTPRKPEFDPTPEQVDAVEKFQTGESLKVNAYAGTGKTSTLTLLSHETRRQGIYLAFNKSIATEAQRKFSHSVVCRTTHSLALAWTFANRQYSKPKLFDSMNANKVRHILGVGKARVNGIDLSSRSVAALVLATLRRFQQSKDETPRWFHVPLQGKLRDASRILLTGDCEEKRDDEIRGFRESIAVQASVLWKKSVDPAGRAPLGHDGYLKLWSLARPDIDADYILLDEAQDTNPAVLSVLVKQTVPVIYVGDRYQQIYSWRGAVNAMENVATRHAGALTQSWRFGPEIASVANVALQRLGETVPLRGNEGITSVVGLADGTPTDAVLCRSNSGVIAEVMSAAEKGRKVAIVGGGSDLLRLLRGVEQLQAGEPTDVAEFFGFKDWAEVVESVKEDANTELAILCGLVEEYGLPPLFDTLSRVVAEPKADVIVSTAHKGKGREWPSVRLSGFFKQQGVPDWAPSEEELRLLYVAMTRAQLKLLLPTKVADYLGMSQREW